ncbi:MAG: histidine kinase dimerization/phospho-acceptor domain-containing protein [Sphingorhabdus sp.]
MNNLFDRIRSAPLVQLLSADEPDIAASAISGARLHDDEWADLVPHLPVRARGFLRNRRDLGVRTKKALAIWSAADFALPYAVAQPAADAEIAAVPTADKSKIYEAGSEPTQIGEIVARIEKLRQEREAEEAPQLPLEGGKRDKAPLANEIRFETDDFGTICWVEGVPRAAVIGIGIAEPAFDDGPGPDAYGASAFRQRMPLENARMRLVGSPSIEGDWRINAAPFFDARSGRFKGYRGILRRPTLAESPKIKVSANVQGEQLQQLVHELRTPLGAIIGFAEIIEQQLFGPVSHDYRVLAQSILADAQKLLSGFDDLATASKMESGHLAIEAGVTDCNWLASRLSERLSGLSEKLGVTLNLAKAEPVRAFAVDNELTERIFSRLLSAVIIGCRKGEELGGRFHTDVGGLPTNHFILSLPHKLRGMGEEELLGSGPGSVDDSDNAPLLGLGFSLRLVRNLARKVQGDLRFDNERLLLTLPAARNGSVWSRGTER